MEKLLDTILSGEGLSGVQMGAETYADWEKFDDACFFTAIDRTLAENLLKLSEKIAEKPGLFAISLSARQLPGATVIVEYEPDGNPFNGSFRVCEEGEVQYVLDTYHESEICKDTYIEVTSLGIEFLAQTESGNCSISIDREDFRRRMERAFADDYSPAMGM